jgi:peptide/nickel transport system substrate-binding protein
MVRKSSKLVPIGNRLVDAVLAAVFALCAVPWGEPARAQQGADAKKSSAIKKEEDPNEKPTVPPPITPDDDEWLKIEPFDRLRVAPEDLPNRNTFISRNDKNNDGKLSKQEWPENVAYAFESFDWNFDSFVEDKELNGVIVDVELLDERPLPKPPPGAPVDAKLRIRLASGEHLEFDIPRNRVLYADVKYFEDLLLDQGRKATNKAELDKAFEFINAVAERAPRWRGIDQSKVEFWFKEAENKLGRASNEEDERVIDLLHQLHDYCVERNAEKCPLCGKVRGDHQERDTCPTRKVIEPSKSRESMGHAMKRIVDRAFEKKQYLLARHRLNTLLADYPELQDGKDLRQQFVQGTPLLPGAERLRQQAKAKEAAGQLRDACFLMLEAADIWPSLPGLDEDFNRIYNKYPILLAAVRELPERFAPWSPPGTPDARVAQLLHVPLMEVSGVGENTKYSSRILDDIALSELARRVTLRVKPGLVWSDGEKPITAHDISRSITARSDRKIPNYDAALASVLKEVRVNSINEVMIDLNRTPLRAQSTFLFNLAAGHRLQGDRLDLNAAVGAGPFRGAGKKTGVEAYLQSNKHFFGGSPQIAEIVERRYPNGKDAVKALLAGDVTLLEHVPHKELRRVEVRKDDLAIARGAVPGLHAISFDFRRREFESWTLRRAMVYAIDRLAILEGALLDGPSSGGEGNELINGPFPKGSFAFEPNLEPWLYDPVLAKGLADASKKELRVSNFKFTLAHPDTEEAATACKFIKEYWRVVGIDVDLRAMPTQQLEEEVALGRRFELVYRVHYVRDPVLDAARVLCLGPPIAPDGAVMPNAASGWLRQTLRDLEFATGWPLANEKLALLQHQARDDVALIPLWQLNDYYAYHKRLKGVVDNSFGMYQDAEKWQIEPWYRKDSN